MKAWSEDMVDQMSFFTSFERKVCASGGIAPLGWVICMSYISFSPALTATLFRACFISGVNVKTSYAVNTWASLFVSGLGQPRFAKLGETLVAIKDKAWTVGVMTPFA